MRCVYQFQPIHLCTQTGHGVAKRDSVVISPPPTPCFPLSLPERSMEGYIPSNGLLGIRTRPPHTYYDNCCGCYNRQACDVLSVSTCKLSHTHHPPPYLSLFATMLRRSLISSVRVHKARAQSLPLRYRRLSLAYELSPARQTEQPKLLHQILWT